MLLQEQYNHHAAWIVGGLILRLAQKMGLHKDGEALNLSPFETEMRRRAWWAFVFLDTNCAVLSGLSPVVRPSDWDTQIPKNINDADLYPSSKQPVQDRDGPTEMIICLAFYNILHSMIGFEGVDTLLLWQNIFNLESARNMHETVTRVTERVLGCIEELYPKFCDPSAGPHHQFTEKLYLLLQKRVHVVEIWDSNSSGSDESTARDSIFQLAVYSMEQTFDTYEAAKEYGYLWFWRTQLQKELFVFMVGQLSQRGQGRFVDRAWETVRTAYKYHEELFNLSSKANFLLATHILSAWENKRAQSAEQTDSTFEDEYFIRRLQNSFDGWAQGSEAMAAETGPTLDSDSAASASEIAPWTATEVNAAELADWEQLSALLTVDNQANF
jgi:hypothetical protein